MKDRTGELWQKLDSANEYRCYYLIVNFINGKSCSSICFDKNMKVLSTKYIECDYEEFTLFCKKLA